MRLCFMYNRLVMKILQINKYYFRKGGAETVFFNTMRLLEKHGHTVIPFSLKNEKNEPSPYENYFVDYPELSESSVCQKIKNLTSFVYNREAARKLELLIQKERPDVAHIHLMFNSMSVSILPVLKKYGIPVVMSVHDYRLVCPAYTFTDGKGRICERCGRGKYYNCILHKCSKDNFFNSLMLCIDSYFRSWFYPPVEYIDRFLFVSKFSMYKHIQIDERFKTKCAYLYNFTPNVEYRQKKGDYILFFGRISEEKGIRTLIEAMRQVPGIKLKIVGVGPLLDELKAVCPPNAEFLGFKKGDELSKLVRDAAFVVVPSKCYENNPMSVIEAYMVGTPVIGCNIGGTPEIIKVGETGFVFPVSDVHALAATIGDAMEMSDVKYFEMSRKARIFAERHFSAEEYYKSLINNYTEVINSHTRNML